MNVLLQASLTSDVVALQQFVDKSEVELGSLPAVNLTSMLDALLVSDEKIKVNVLRHAAACPISANLVATVVSGQSLKSSSAAEEKCMWIKR